MRDDSVWSFVYAVGVRWFTGLNDDPYPPWVRCWPCRRPWAASNYCIGWTGVKRSDAVVMGDSDLWAMVGKLSSEKSISVGILFVLQDRVDRAVA